MLSGLKFQLRILEEEKMIHQRKYFSHQHLSLINFVNETIRSDY